MLGLVWNIWNQTTEYIFFRIVTQSHNIFKLLLLAVILNHIIGYKNDIK